MFVLQVILTSLAVVLPLLEAFAYFLFFFLDYECLLLLLA